MRRGGKSCYCFGCDGGGVRPVFFQHNVGRKKRENGKEKKAQHYLPLIVPAPTKSSPESMPSRISLNKRREKKVGKEEGDLHNLKLSY